MPDTTAYAAFLMAVLAMQLVPGPETMLVLSRGIGQGRRVAFWTVLGMTLAAHHCSRCRDGEKACVRGGHHRCEWPHARNH
jgi:hypothetical protein